MKTDIHPEYVESQVVCTCGNSFTTRSTTPSISVEICSACHPFYTGKQKLMDTGGRVERFRRRAAKSSPQAQEAKQAGAAASESAPVAEAAPVDAPAEAPVEAPAEA